MAVTIGYQKVEQRHPTAIQCACRASESTTLKDWLRIATTSSIQMVELITEAGSGKRYTRKM